MFSCDALKEKIIIVAEHEAGLVHDILMSLRSKGFLNVYSVNSVQEIYQILRPYHDQPDKVGLIVLNPALPFDPVEEMYQILSGAGNGFEIPFILLGENVDAELMGGWSRKPNNIDAYKLTYRLKIPIDPQELLLAVNFLLSLKQERFLRYQQEQQLVNELAAKNLIDAKLKFLVTHDELTGLLNRSSFEIQLRKMLGSSNPLLSEGVLLFIDVDRFSLINELEGFEVGDKLLVELAVLVRKLVPTDSLFARIGNDEFCLFLKYKSKNQARVFAETIRNTIDNYRFFSADVCYGASVSIGIASFETGNSKVHPGEMILHARQACHFAKISGRDKVWVYNNEDDAVKEHRDDIYWVPLIRKSIRENRLILAFQPVVELGDGNISHYEVLIRMLGDNQEIIGPDKFIPAAERMGLIHSIDLWVVENAIEFLAKLPVDRAGVCLAINLSCTAFQYPDLLLVIRERLDATRIDPGRLAFEITETAAVDNFEKARIMINKIQALGCKFALDDFGAGFCSFNYLKTFPVDYVKIDGQFIKNLLSDETDQILVKSMVEIAGKLGKKTIAEFVETPNIALKLKEIGVHYGQGYAFGRPERFLLESYTLPTNLLS